VPRAPVPRRVLLEKMRPVQDAPHSKTVREIRSAAKLASRSFFVEDDFGAPGEAGR